MTAKGAEKSRHKADNSENRRERFYGKHVAAAIFHARGNEVISLTLAGKEEYHKDLLALAHEYGTPVSFLSWPDFSRAGKFHKNERHQGVFVDVKARPPWGEADLERLEGARAVIVLDQVSNPQNLAAILRAAAFFHINALCYMKHRSATPTAEVASIAAGGTEFVELFEITNVARSLIDLRSLGFQIYGLDERGDRTLAEEALGEKVVFVIGAEGEGLRKKTRETCDRLLQIPGGRKGVESLNAGVAATIALYELCRKGYPA